MAAQQSKEWAGVRAAHGDVSEQEGCTAAGLQRSAHRTTPLKQNSQKRTPKGRGTQRVRGCQGWGWGTETGGRKGFWRAQATLEGDGRDPALTVTGTRVCSDFQL